MKVFQHLNLNRRNPKWVNNWGDVISADLVSKLTGRSFQATNNGAENGKMLAAGSVMWRTMPKDIVWGTGCIRPINSVGKKPAKVLAVRGPLTRQVLQKQGIDCPEVYGDPALLMPKIYKFDHKPTYEYGIIPHYVDANLPEIIKLQADGVKIIDICSTDFLHQLHDVKRVLSSSLHGLIAADAYGIPNARLVASDKITGGDFKFNDYFKSVNRPIEKVDLKGLKALTLSEINYNDRIQIDLDSLLEPLMLEFGVI